MMRAIVVRVCPHVRARRLLALAGVASAVFGVLWTVAGQRDWSGLAGARVRHDAALAQRERAEHRLEPRQDSRQDSRPIESEPSRPGEASWQASPDDRASRSPPSPPGLPEGRRSGREPPLDPGWQLAVGAHDSGLRIRRLGPAQQAGAEVAAGGVRHYDIAGDGRFGAIAAWVRSLAALPMAVVPVDIEVRRQGDGASFSARLTVSPPEPGAPDVVPGPVVMAGLGLTDTEFGADFGGREPAAMPRVAGIVRDARRGLALFDAEAGAWSALVGERVGAERITRIDGGGVWLGLDDGGGAHRMVLCEKAAAMMRDRGKVPCRLVAPFALWLTIGHPPPARAMLQPPLPVVMPAAAVDGTGWFDPELGRVSGSRALADPQDAGVAPAAAGERYGGEGGAASAGGMSPLPAGEPKDPTSPRASPLATGTGEAAGQASTAAPGVDGKPAETARPDAPPPALEGPPIPLPPPERLSGLMVVPRGAADRRRISLDLQQAPLAAVFDAFARFTGQSVVLSGRVQGSATLRIHDVPWRDALDALLDANGLAMAMRGDVIWVAPAAELTARGRARFEAHARMADLEPLASRTFLLRYPRANDVARLLTGAAANQRVLSRRGSVLADARTNLLFVTDLDGRLAQIAALVAQLDRPSRQVLIEARVVEGERGFSRELGARLALRTTRSLARGDGAGSGGAPGSAESAAGEGAPAGSGKPPATGLVGGPEGRLADLAAHPIGGFEAATAGLTLFVAGASRLLDLELSALESQGRGQIVSRPRVVTADRASALIEQGTELPYQAKVGRGVSGVQFRRATLKLEVEPQITPDGHVVLDLDIAKDSADEQNDAGPAIHTKHVHTRVEVENGARSRSAAFTSATNGTM